MSRRRPGRGQAAVEMLALLPLLALVALMGWQLAAVVAAGMRAQDEVRTAALRAEGSGRVVTVGAAADVGVLVPGLGHLRVPARIGVRTP
jgi:Flp pilus assembly protein TadG